MSLILLLLATAYSHELRIDVLDVGQGDSILITAEDPQKVVLIDAGEPSAHVVDQLVARGIDHIDLAVSTHAHADHIGGMAAVLRTIPVKFYLDGGESYSTRTWSDLAATVREAQQRWGTEVVHPWTSFRQAKLGHATLSLLSPPSKRFTGTESDENANSIVLRLDHGTDCLLFMGDADRVTEQGLVAQGVESCDVLKVGHHGSDDASTGEFLAAIRPSDALVSLGRNNQYRHPGENTLQRLEQANVTVWRTDLLGTLTVRSSGSGWTIDPTKAPAKVASCPYPASRNSDVFHRDGCPNAARISSENRQCHPSAAAAVNAGKRPATCCDPMEGR